jgi:catechol 2,3-dioxygenase-like lactoylglutathione lyase family enzyme
VIQGIEHPAIAAADVTSLADWYVDVLGFEIVYRSANAIFVRAGDGSLIELIHAEGPRQEQSLKTPGLRHLALKVADFEAAYSRLQSKDVKFVTEPQENKGNKVVFFTDPEGNYLHLIYRATPLAS